MNEQELDYLFENNLSLYKEKIRSGEIPHEHHLHWDRASETFNTEIQSCCECGYVDFPRLNEMEEAIERLRELADFYDGKDFESNPMGYGQLKNDSNSISYKVAAYNIRKALDGEQ